MKWRKLGKIFDPAAIHLPNNCVEFARSPQALVFDDYVRIYFSAVEEEPGGKLLSRVFYVDFDKSFQRILGYSAHEVIPLGALGSFDEHGIFPFNVYRHQDTLMAYTTGWNRKVAVSVDAAIGYATSTDGGKTFQKLGQGPVVAPSLHEPFLVGDAFVARFEDSFYMWYIHGTKWLQGPGNEAPQRVYKITSARSDDGICWRKDNRHIISDVLDENECQALPAVIKIGDSYHMYFCYRHAIGFRDQAEKGYRLGYAFSSDLVNWTRDDANAGIGLSDSGWDSQMMCYPNVFHCDGKVYMLYNGNEFGRCGFGLALLESDENHPK
ncbi:hypothetical protein [Thalassomonas haliotis]|uniref:Glycosylase n=1 Tax=Thalassomonas haliotis TaxID=485448 RepID=A0ABY7VED9_9GAMM|nr:hypothetical protein [Thalassomonas haliotis]WDE12080.1 hypothetical protein H3N35_00895 [Thalassomonas haliotis]